MEGELGMVRGAGTRISLVSPLRWWGRGGQRQQWRRGIRIWEKPKLWRKAYGGGRRKM